MTALVLVVMVGGRMAALGADRVNSVIEPHSIVPVPRAPAHVAGLTALRSRPLTLLDCRAALGFVNDEHANECRRAVVVEHEGHLYGLLVDAADDIVPALGDPVPMAGDPGEGWNRVAKAMVETALGPLLLLDVPTLIAGMSVSRAA